MIQIETTPQLHEKYFSNKVIFLFMHTYKQLNRQSPFIYLIPKQLINRFIQKRVQ